MKLLSQLDKIITKINSVFFGLGAIFTFCLILFMFSSVIFRYLFNISSVWFDELLWHFFGLSFLLAMAYSLHQEDHVRVDILFQKYSPKTKAWIDIAGVLIFLLPLCGMISFYGYFYALTAYQNNEISGNPNGMPYRWFIKSAIPFGFILLMFQSFAHLIKQLFIIVGHASESKGNSKQ